VNLAKTSISTVDPVEFVTVVDRECVSRPTEEVNSMTICATCGNDYDKTFTVTWPDGRSETFDCIECAAAQLAPECTHCGCRILGHGVETPEGIFCCAHCARKDSNADVNDRYPVPAGG
jgi:hypothetical protein